jgi:uncharacterized protein with HEPN domain
MSRDDGVLLDILNAARLAEEFTRGLRKAGFLSDPKTCFAVLHQLIVIGEAAKRLSPDFRGAHPEIPWKSIAGLRDILVHEYDTVDLDEVWRTVQSDLPKLIAFAERLSPGGP